MSCSIAPSSQSRRRRPPPPATLPTTSSRLEVIVVPCTYAFLFHAQIDSAIQFFADDGSACATLGLEKLGEGQLNGPEDVYVDAAAGGTLYTATRDGWLQRMQPNGTWERWRFAGSAGLLGIAPSADGSMLVCDACKGLLGVEEGRMTILASTVEGSPTRFAEAVIEASDGTVYFSDGNTRFDIDQWFLDYLEASSTGHLLKYEPITGKVSVVLDNLAFANGVALSQEETFVVVCES